MDEDRYQEHLRQKFVETAGEIDRYRRECLELQKRHFDFVSDWMTTVSMLCFAIGGAVVPLINQFSTQGSVAHPNLLFLAALILIVNGATILIMKKYRIEKGLNTITSVTLPYEILFTKTYAVLRDALSQRAPRHHVDQRFEEQFHELTAALKAGEPKKADRPTFELDIYLGIMLIGFACIFGSVIDNPHRLLLYGLVILTVVLGYVLHIAISYRRVQGLLHERERLRQQLRDAEQYRVGYW